jgi:hypothetical protein
MHLVRGSIPLSVVVMPISRRLTPALTGAERTKGARAFEWRAFTCKAMFSPIRSAVPRLGITEMI